MRDPCSECQRVAKWRGVGVPGTCLIPHGEKLVRYNTRKARLKGPCGADGKYFCSIHQIGLPRDVTHPEDFEVLMDQSDDLDTWDFLGQVV